MHGRRLYCLLGYVRLGDYLTERLGMSLRRCQAILRLERALARLPRLARAYEAGALSVSKLELIAPAATADTEEAWLERATRLPLDSLRELAREASSGSGTPAVFGTTGPAAPASATPAVAAPPLSATPVSGTPVAAPPVSTPPGSAAPLVSALPLSAAPVSATPLACAPPPAGPIEEDEPGRIVSFSAPAPVLAIWHWTLDLVRRVAGQQEPAWRCAEYLAAEFLSGVPDPVPPSSGRLRPSPDPFPPVADPCASRVSSSNFV